MVEGARLESVYTGNRIAGSNPAPSASLFIHIIVLLNTISSKNAKGLISGFSFPAACSLVKTSEALGLTTSALAAHGLHRRLTRKRPYSQCRLPSGDCGASGGPLSLGRAKQASTYRCSQSCQAATMPKGGEGHGEREQSGRTRPNMRFVSRR